MLPSLRAVDGRCLEVSFGTWEPDPFLDYFLLIGNDVLFCIAKSRYRIGSGPHVPSETSRHRPPTALKLGSEDSRLSGTYALDGDSCPVRRGLAEQNERRQNLVWVSTPQRGNLSCILFSGTIIVGLKTEFISYF